MDTDWYERFLAAARTRRKEEAARAAAAFVASFANDAERAAWTQDYLVTHAYGSRVRHEIYAGVIFPILIAGANRGDAESLYWLAGTAQNHYSDRRLGEQLGFKTELGLLKQAYAIEPRRDEVRRALLAAVLAFLDHATHEWPAVILWGMDGATPTQCNEILGEIRLARTLDADGACGQLIDDIESKVRAYQRLLLQNRSA